MNSIHRMLTACRRPGSWNLVLLLALVGGIIPARLIQSQTQRHAGTRIIVVHDEHGVPVDNARVIISPPDSVSNARYAGALRNEGTYAVEIPEELIASPLRVTVWVAGRLRYDVTRSLAEQRVEVTFNARQPAPVIAPEVSQPSAEGSFLILSAHPASTEICQHVRVNWTVRKKVNGIRLRHRLAWPVGADISAGAKSEAWTEWNDVASGSVEYTDLNVMGTYTFSVEYAVDTGEVQKTETRFSMTWKDPVVLGGRLGIDWAAVKAAPKAAVHDSLLGREFEREGRREVSTLKSRIDTLKLHSTPDELVGKIRSVLMRARTDSLLRVVSTMESEFPPSSYARLVPGSKIYELARAGCWDLIPAFRDPAANRAITMAAIAEYASHFFHERLHGGPPVAQIPEQTEETASVVTPPSAVPAKSVAAALPGENPSTGDSTGMPEKSRAEQAKPGARTGSDESAEYAVDEGYGRNGIQLVTGFSMIGPQVEFGATAGPVGLEAYFIYQLIDWERNQNLWNKPTSGGYQAGINIFPFFGDSFLSWRLKPFLGGGFGRMDEKLGTGAFVTAGDPSKGYWLWADAHAGVRFYLLWGITFEAWGGGVLWKSDKHSMLTLKPGTGIEENFSKVSGSVSIGYAW